MHSQSERGTKSGGDRLRSVQERSVGADRLARGAVIDDDAELKTVQERAAFYRKRALQIRKLLEQMKDNQARALLTQTIRNYEHLALLVEGRASERPH